jgi:hypothetical protein
VIRGQRRTKLPILGKSKRGDRRLDVQIVSDPCQ